jgi:CheY-like chemotaxis protein
MLAHTGYQVRTACDGVSALREIETGVPDLIVSDLNMPRMSGFELLSVLRAQFPAIPLIAMSGAFSGSQVPNGVIAEAFYEKGTDPSRLMQLVSAMMRPQAVQRDTCD